MTDYFIVAGAETTIQVRAIAEGVIEALEKKGVPYLRREGWEDAHWILIDYGDLVVHVFLRADREYYDLERLWGDAKRLSVDEVKNLAEV
jgi:ribosome-associated protein